MSTQHKVGIVVLYPIDKHKLKERASTYTPDKLTHINTQRKRKHTKNKQSKTHYTHTHANVSHLQKKIIHNTQINLNKQKLGEP